MAMIAGSRRGFNERRRWRAPSKLLDALVALAGLPRQRVALPTEGSERPLILLPNATGQSMAYIEGSGLSGSFL